MDDLKPLLTPKEAPVIVDIKRGSRAAALTLSNAAKTSDAIGETLDAGLLLQSASGSLRVVDVRPGSRAARAGIEAGDLLIRLDRTEPRSLRDAQRLLGRRDAGTHLVEVERGGRRLAFLLPSPSAP